MNKQPCNTFPYQKYYIIMEKEFIDILVMFLYIQTTISMEEIQLKMECVS